MRWRRHDRGDQFPAAAQTLTYSYNALGRLTGVTSSTGPTVGYTYDSAGNRTQQATALSFAAVAPAPSAAKARPAKAPVESASTAAKTAKR